MYPNTQNQLLSQTEPNINQGNNFFFFEGTQRK